LKTLEKFARGLSSVPTATAWYLEGLGRSRGRQELYTRQSPERLARLREHAMIESAVSSNRMEGVEVDKSRVATLVFGTSPYADRNEEEIRGYRRALEWVHKDAERIELSERTVRRLHELSRGEIWDAGRYKERDGDIIETYPDGRSRVRFRTVPAAETAAHMARLVELNGRASRERWVPEPLRLAAMNLDFLCIHPFRDGNGRVSRLMLLLDAYRSGFEVGRYISLERLIEQNKERYYETLEQCSRGWHEGQHDPWPFINFMLSIFKEAYARFESRFDALPRPRGEKTSAVLAALERIDGTFRMQELRRECPGVSDDMLRKILKKLKDEGRVECIGRGPAARWEKK
jgi:Fic family protein